MTAVVALTLTSSTLGCHTPRRAAIATPNGSVSTGVTSAARSWRHALAVAPGSWWSWPYPAAGGCPSPSAATRRQE